MEKLRQIVSSSPAQKRKHRRFRLQYPVHIKAQSTDLTVEFEAVSRNISICGLLLESDSMIPQHTPVSFVVTVEHSDLGRSLRFAGEGKVVRVDPKAVEGRFAIAVECQSPISQIDAHFPMPGC
jgi:PilZ domain